MLFWVTATLLTACAVLSVLVPLVRRAPDAEQPSSHDLEVYRDQLAELDRDAARGLIRAAEAEEARAEIARRILKIAGEHSGPAAGRPRKFGVARAGAFAAVLSVPLVSWGLYAVLGSPDMPSQPLAARLAADPAECAGRRADCARRGASGRQFRTTAAAGTCWPRSICAWAASTMRSRPSARRSGSSARPPTARPGLARRSPLQRAGSSAPRPRARSSAR